MTTKYTPAPWFFEDSDIFNEKGEHIACTDGFFDSDLVNEANAKLIAAAPDLLAALIACDEAMEYISEYDIPLTLSQQVKDAIAKATT